MCMSELDSPDAVVTYRNLNTVIWAHSLQITISTPKSRQPAAVAVMHGWLEDLSGQSAEAA